MFRKIESRQIQVALETMGVANEAASLSPIHVCLDIVAHARYEAFRALQPRLVHEMDQYSCAETMSLMLLPDNDLAGKV